MSIVEGIIGPIAGLIDKIIPDPKARDVAKLELLSSRTVRIWTFCEINSPPFWQRRSRLIHGRAGPGRAFSTSCT